MGCAVAAALAWPHAASAQSAPDNNWYWGVNAGARYTDNVNRSSVNEESETVGIAGLLFGITTDRPRLDADVAGNIEYRKYLDDSYDNEVAGGVAALVSYAFIPERFVWVATDNFSQVASNITTVSTPDNRENVNYLSTGPDFTIGLTGRMSLLLSGRVNDTYYEEADTDSSGLSGTLALIRQMSNDSALSLNASTTEVDFDEDVFIDYRIDSGFLRWSTETDRTTIILDGGYNRIDSDTGTDDDTSDGLLARLELSRAVGARSRLGLTAGTGFETPGQGLRRDQDVVGVDPGLEDAIVGGDAYRADYAYLTFTTEWERSSFSAVVDARSEAHEDIEAADRDVYGALIRLERQISQRLTVDANASYAKDNLTGIDFEFDEWSVGLGLSFQMTESVAIHTRIAHIEGSSEDNTRDFDENTAYIGVTYSRGR